MSPTLVVLVLAASPAPVKLAAPGLTPLNLTAQAATFYSDHLAQQLTELGLRVVTPSELAAVLGLERQKALMGCSADGADSCMAELANAMGVDGIITGSLGKVGEVYQVNIKVVAASSAEPLATHSGRVSREEALLDECSRGARSLALQLLKRLRGEEAARALELRTAPTARSYAWIPAVSGGVVAAVGAGLLVAAQLRADSLAGGATGLGLGDEAGRSAFIAAGQREQALGVAGVAVGSAALLTAGAMLLFGAPPPVTPSVSWIPGGASVAVSVVLP
jgi:hypothetical protein